MEVFFKDYINFYIGHIGQKLTQAKYQLHLYS